MTARRKTPDAKAIDDIAAAKATGELVRYLFPLIQERQPKATRAAWLELLKSLEPPKPGPKCHPGEWERCKAAMRLVLKGAKKKAAAAKAGCELWRLYDYDSELRDELEREKSLAN